jgi:hypothetical protein
VLVFLVAVGWFLWYTIVNLIKNMVICEPRRSRDPYLLTPERPDAIRFMEEQKANEPLPRSPSIAQRLPITSAMKAVTWSRR